MGCSSPSSSGGPGQGAVASQVHDWWTLFLQFSLLPSQLGCGIGRLWKGFAVSNRMHSTVEQGRVPLAHIISWSCFVSLSWTQTEVQILNEGGRRGWEQQKFLIKWKSVVCLILQGLLCRVDIPCLGGDKLPVSARSPRTFTRLWVGILPGIGWFLSTLIPCSSFPRPGVWQHF